MQLIINMKKRTVLKNKLIYMFDIIIYYFKYYLSPKKQINNNGILIFTHDFERAGAQVLIYNVVKYYCNIGISVVVISSRIGPMTSEFKKLCPTYVMNLKRIEKKVEYLNQVCNYESAICNTVVCGRYIGVLKKHNYKIISLVHEMSNLIYEKNLEKECNLIYNFSNYIVFPSKYVEKSFYSVIKSDIIKGNSLIMNQGLFNNETLDITKKEAKTYVSKLVKHQLDGKFVVLGVATACLRKGYDLFLDIAYNISKTEKNVYFIWVGNGYESLLQSKLKQYQISKFDNVFMTGYIKDTEKLDYLYKSANLYALTSREEPFGSVVLESFKSGVPVIAFKDCGGYMDVVKENITGYLVKPYDTSEFSNLIVKLEKKNEDLEKNCIFEASQHNFDNYCSTLVKFFDIHTVNGSDDNE